ncbi:MAG: DUF3696 domain-containing protein [Nitrospirae bacterium]|nr:DUF3696 domain-containing protein [Nitrospirota bacterium]
MIDYVRLERFKCFLDETIPLAPLTILAGANNTGKSTVIQSLLLMKQTVQTSGYTPPEKPKNEIKGGLWPSMVPPKQGLFHGAIPPVAINWPNITPPNHGLFGAINWSNITPPKNWVISINGPLIHIGSAWDIFCQESGADDIIISLGISKHPEKILKLKLLYDVNNSYTYHMKAEFNNEFVSLHDLLSKMRFTYIEAMRTGPQLFYPASDVPIRDMSVGSMGQFTIHCLYQHGEENIAVNRLAYVEEEVKSMTLLYQTERWMNYLIHGIAFKTNKIIEADVFTVGIRDVNRDTEFFKPTNVGFGIMYSLPIVVAALMSRAGDVLICENPESHLHPEAQSRLGMFLAIVADAGIQVVLETHSDHILNGSRIAVKKGIITNSNVAINSFDRDHNVSSPVMDENGRIDSWPKGFFDQLDIDLMELI